MSVINKKTFIKKISEETSDADLAVLNGLLNGATNTLFKSLINVAHPITGDDKGANYCVLVAYDGKSQKMFSVILDLTTDSYEIVDEELYAIKRGDIIVKKTIEGDHILSHAYICTYKKDKAGICLSYFDASSAADLITMYDCYAYGNGQAEKRW